VTKGKAIIGIVIIGVILIGLLVYRGQTDDQSTSLKMPGASASLSLGITYLQINPALSAYYGLGVDSGALVTGVASGSLAERAGIRKGNVIISFNGTSLGEKTPFLGMMRQCNSGTRIEMEIWSENGIRTIELAHIAD